MRWIAWVVSLLLVVIYWQRTGIERSTVLVHVAQPSSTSVVAVTDNGGQLFDSEHRVAQELHELTLPASLRDVQPRFALQQDEQGNLLITLEVMDLFEFYLSAKGELDEDEIRAWVERYVQNRLSEPAQSQARQLYARYVHYLKAAADLPVYEWQGLVQHQIDWQTIRQQLTDVDALRRYYFPDAYEVFFAEDAAHTLQLLNQMQYGEAVALTESQQRNVFVVQRQGVDHANDTDAFNRSSANGGVILSDDVQDRMAIRAEQRALWQQRIEQFSQWYSGLQQADLANDEYQAQRERELAKRFNESEQYRVKTLLSLW